MAKNKQGGLDPTDQSALERAKESDLITLPENVQGTNCANCQFFKPIAKDGTGYCLHPKVLQPVNKRMCCAFWSRPEVIRPWLNKVKK